MRPLRALGSLGALVVLLVWGPPLCPLQNMWGIPCPGCGLTRATVALAQGDVARALHLHPLVWLMLPIVVAYVGEDVWRYLTGKRLVLLSRVPNPVWYAVAAALLGVWIARFLGAFGGPVDPIDFAHSWIGTVCRWFAA